MSIKKENEMRIAVVVVVIIMFVLLFLVSNIETAKSAEPDAKERLANCKTNIECAVAFDEVYGKGAAAKMEAILKECDLETPLEDCVFGDKAKGLWVVIEPQDKK
jgi:hypothetical protein